MSKISGQFQISGQFEGTFKISGISGQLGPQKTPRLRNVTQSVLLLNHLIAYHSYSQTDQRVVVQWRNQQFSTGSWTSSESAAMSVSALMHKNCSCILYTTSYKNMLNEA